MALFAVIDVETTGLAAAQGDRVVELAVIVLDDRFRVLRMLDSLVHPQRSIPGRVSQLHGISDCDVREAPTFAELLPMLMECLDGVTHMVAHNIEFDLGFLRSEMKQCGLRMPRSFAQVCTMQLARQHGVARDAKLSTVAAALRIPTVANVHRAIVDAGITARILSLLHESENGKASGPIRWVPHHVMAEHRPALPRKAPAIPLQALSQFGLSIADNAD